MSNPGMTDIGLILLAAGDSQRLGTPKQLLRDPEGQSLILRAAQTALASACRPLVAVLGAGADEVQRELDGLPLLTAINPDWQTGMASSIRVGLNALVTSSPLEGVVVMLCDQPFVSAALLDSLIAAHYASGHNLVACEYGDHVGVPALFGRSLFDALATLDGDQGARRVIRDYAGPTTRIPFPEGRFDVDTMQDAERWRHNFPAI